MTYFVGKIFRGDRHPHPHLTDEADETICRDVPMQKPQISFYFTHYEMFSFVLQNLLPYSGLPAFNVMRAKQCYPTGMQVNRCLWSPLNVYAMQYDWR